MLLNTRKQLIEFFYCHVVTYKIHLDQHQVMTYYSVRKGETEMATWNYIPPEFSHPN